ncbi:MAG: hypothetical protein U0527_04510 [Candidatus Eisenbacteria bacterium]
MSEVLLATIRRWGACPGSRRGPPLTRAVGLPSVDRLRGVSPNPIRAARGRAEVRFDLAEAEPVALDLFDPSGRKLLELAHGDFAAGQHQATGTVERFRRGTYFLQLAARSARGWWCCRGARASLVTHEHERNRDGPPAAGFHIEGDRRRRVAAVRRVAIR